MIAAAVAFDGPVLLLHGDTHHFRTDRLLQRSHGLANLRARRMLRVALLLFLGADPLGSGTSPSRSRQRSPIASRSASGRCHDPRKPSAARQQHFSAARRRSGGFGAAASTERRMGDLTLRQFLRRHWQRQPLLVRQALTQPGRRA